MPNIENSGNYYYRNNLIKHSWFNRMNSESDVLRVYLTPTKYYVYSVVLISLVCMGTTVVLSLYQVCDIRVDGTTSSPS